MTITPCAPPEDDAFWTFSSLHRAAHAARRGKHLSRTSAAFFVDLETNLFALERELSAGTWHPGAFTSFVLADPKPRIISAAPFRDRVVHHAMCATLGPRLDALAHPASFACRVGLGTSAALARAREVIAAASPGAWFLKLDVRRYFETIDHAVLLRELTPHLGSSRLATAMTRIIRAGAPGSPAGRGLPIGNLTSQHLANFYLTAFDHAVSNDEARARGLTYLRYMDDLLFVGPDRATITAAQDLATDLLESDRRVSVKHEATRRGPISSGVPFLGFRIWPGLVRLDRHRKRRLARGLRSVSRELATTGDEDRAASRAGSLGAWARMAGADALLTSLTHIHNLTTAS